MNPYLAFQALVDKSITQVATVTGANGNRLTVELIGGGTMFVTGNATLGSKVLIKDDEVVSVILSMTEYDMVLY